jgi:hypothetical protein
MFVSLVRGRLLVAISLVGILQFAISQSAQATIAYNNPGPFVAPIPNPGLPAPSRVFGKEYSHNQDQTTLAGGGGPDPAQVIAWDGLGGAADGLDYSLPAPPFSTSGLFQVDAIANTHDALFKSLVRMQDGAVVFPDETHLIYSVADVARKTLAGGLLPVNVPPGGPIAAGPNSIGGAGEVSYELAGGFHPPNTHGTWATLTDINLMPNPRDLDGLEVWGPEPNVLPLDGDASGFGDSDKYSVDTDVSTAGAAGPFSVWNYDTSAAATGSTPYVSHALVASLVQQLLDEPNLRPDEVDLDALMVQDDDKPFTQFDPGDKIIFSIRQVAATFAADGSGFLATGSEIFWMDGASTAALPVGGFLFHGSHLWDKMYALNNMTSLLLDDSGAPVKVQLDLDALEAISTPEPASALLLLIGVAALGAMRRSTA